MADVLDLINIFNQMIKKWPIRSLLLYEWIDFVSG
jgi:hypothetical protein